MSEMRFLRVPRVLVGLEPLALDMTQIRTAESRLSEVAITNTQRAPELLALFNGAYLDAKKYMNLVEYELDLAKNRAAQIKAVFLIDKLPQLLADKGWSSPRSPLGSEDVRLAFLESDRDYRDIQDLMCTLRSYEGLFETLTEGFENAYNSVKKLVGLEQHPYRVNPNLTHGLQGPSPKTNNHDDDFFGTPK